MSSLRLLLVASLTGALPLQVRCGHWHRIALNVHGETGGENDAMTDGLSLHVSDYDNKNNSHGELDVGLKKSDLTARVVVDAYVSGPDAIVSEFASDEVTFPHDAAPLYARENASLLKASAETSAPKNKSLQTAPATASTRKVAASDKQTLRIKSSPAKSAKPKAEAVGFGHAHIEETFVLYIPHTLHWPSAKHDLTPVQIWRNFWLIPWHATVGLIVVIVTFLTMEECVIRYYIRQKTEVLLWITVSAVVCGYIGYVYGPEARTKWLTGYVYEWIFCVDDLFIFHYIFQNYAMPVEFTRKALFTCLCGQLVTRFAYYLGLAHAIRSLSIVHYFAGAVLMYNGMGALAETLDKHHDHSNQDPTQTFLVRGVETLLGGRLLKRWKQAKIVRSKTVHFGRQLSPGSTEPEKQITQTAPAVPEGSAGALLQKVGENTMPPEAIDPVPLALPAHEEHRADALQHCHSAPLPATRPEYEVALLVRGEDGKLRASLLVPVVLCMLVTDVVLGADCTIAKIESIEGPFWNLSSSMTALFGIRSCYCWVATLADKVAYIQVGIAIVLMYIGFELVAMDFMHISTVASFLVIFSIFFVTSVASFAVSTEETSNTDFVKEAPPRGTTNGTSQ